MRLLKTGPYVPGDEKIEIIQKWGRDITPYAILSHTWSANPEDEVLLSDVQHGTCARKTGYSKLFMSLKKARLDGYGWLWNDTCCIDKTSSVELSEAINSMYNYYRDSEKCYAYLSDVAGDANPGDFAKSRWWKRGWTLQELLAPKQIEFFDCMWQSIGFKDRLHEQITQITGIEIEYLTNAHPVTHASIAKRMSWAASRLTTREEDIAYCLIGIFDVTLNMLYGEGATRAFLRLQEEIMRSNEDQSLFAWIMGDDKCESYHGLLADSPRHFAHTGSTISSTRHGGYNPSTMTARGLHVAFPLTPKADDSRIAALQCTNSGLKYNDWLAVYLRKLPGRDQYARVHCHKLASVSELGQLQELYIRQNFHDLEERIISPYHFFQIRSLGSHSDWQELASYRIIDAVRQRNLNVGGGPVAAPQPFCLKDIPLVYRMDKTAGSLTAALLIKRDHDQEAFVLMLGTSSDFVVAFDVQDTDSVEPLQNMSKVFTPRPVGEYMNLQYHQVRVSVEEQVNNANQKISFLDVDIAGFPTPPTAADMFESAAEVLISPNKRAAKAELKDRIVRRFLAVGKNAS